MFVCLFEIVTIGISSDHIKIKNEAMCSATPTDVIYREGGGGVPDPEVVKENQICTLVLIEFSPKGLPPAIEVIFVRPF